MPDNEIVTPVAAYYDVIKVAELAKDHEDPSYAMWRELGEHGLVLITTRDLKMLQEAAEDARQETGCMLSMSIVSALIGAALGYGVATLFS
jgi:hypothetical protein